MPSMEVGGAYKVRWIMTPRQKKFVEAYEGNATEAARIAGYAKPRREGYRLLTHADIQKAIAERDQVQHNALIADRQARQAMWTKVMYDENQSMKDRLKASELLGKSQADFVQRIEQDTEVTVRWSE